MSEVGKDVEREVLFVFATSVSKVSGNCILFLCFSEKLTQSQTPLHLQIDIPRPCSASREAGEEEAGQSSWGSRKKLGRHRNHPAPRHIAQFLASSWTSLFLHLCQHLWIEYLFKENVICFCATSHRTASGLKWREKKSSDGCSTVLGSPGVEMRYRAPMVRACCGDGSVFLEILFWAQLVQRGCQV